MTSIIQAIIGCIRGPVSYHASNTGDYQAKRIATEALNVLFKAEKSGEDLKKKLDEIVGAYGWTENIAQRVFNGLVAAVKEGAVMGQAMTEAFDKALNAAAEFSEDHPMFCTVVALGILAVLAPWALEALGFAEGGILEGSFAAGWQARYAGYVPKGSLFAYFQRLGMVWRRKIAA